METLILYFLWEICKAYFLKSVWLLWKCCMFSRNIAPSFRGIQKSSYQNFFFILFEKEKSSLHNLEYILTHSSLQIYFGVLINVEKHQQWSHLSLGKSETSKIRQLLSDSETHRKVNMRGYFFSIIIVPTTMQIVILVNFRIISDRLLSANFWKVQYLDFSTQIWGDNHFWELWPIPRENLPKNQLWWETAQHVMTREQGLLSERKCYPMSRLLSR